MFYNYGKNYFLSIDYYDLTNTSNIEILAFLRGYIDINSKIILPANITNYNKNLNSIYDKYPLMILHFRKETNVDNLLLDRVIKLFNEYIHVNFILESKKKIYNKIKYNIIIKLENYNVLKFLNYIYPDNTDIVEIDHYIYSIYNTLGNYKYINIDSENDQIQFFIPRCNIKLILNYAIKPFKNDISDIGYQLYIIKEKKRLSSKTIIYETGIICNPQYGYYLDIIYSDELSKFGYISNCKNIISNKPIEITLTKIDNELNDIKLPFMVGYIVLKEFNHFQLIY